MQLCCDLMLKKSAIYFFYIYFLLVCRKRHNNFLFTYFSSHIFFQRNFMKITDKDVEEGEVRMVQTNLPLYKEEVVGTQKEDYRSKDNFENTLNSSDSEEEEQI